MKLIYLMFEILITFRIVYISIIQSEIRIFFNIFFNKTILSTSNVHNIDSINLMLITLSYFIKELKFLLL